MTQTPSSDENALSPNDINNEKNPSTPSPKSVTRKKQKSQGISWLEEPYCTVRGETALWVAVITQAMMDALSRSKNPEAIYHKHEAIRWLSDNSKDFVQVCLFAGFDPDYVRRKAKRSLLSATAWRAAPGKGKRYLERKAYRQRIKEGTNFSPVLSAPPSAPPDKVIPGPWQ